MSIWQGMGNTALELAISNFKISCYLIADEWMHTKGKVTCQLTVWVISWYKRNGCVIHMLVTVTSLYWMKWMLFHNISLSVFNFRWNISEDWNSYVTFCGWLINFISTHYESGMVNGNNNSIKQLESKAEIYSTLPHWGLVTPDGDRDLIQHWLR